MLLSTSALTLLHQSLLMGAFMLAVMGRNSASDRMTTCNGHREAWLHAWRAWACMRAAARVKAASSAAATSLRAMVTQALPKEATVRDESLARRPERPSRMREAELCCVSHVAMRDPTEPRPPGQQYNPELLHVEGQYIYFEVVLRTISSRSLDVFTMQQAIGLLWRKPAVTLNKRMKEMKSCGVWTAHQSQ